MRLFPAAGANTRKRTNEKSSSLQVHHVRVISFNLYCFFLLSCWIGDVVRFSWFLIGRDHARGESWCVIKLLVCMYFGASFHSACFPGAHVVVKELPASSPVDRTHVLIYQTWLFVMIFRVEWMTGSEFGFGASVLHGHYYLCTTCSPSIVHISSPVKLGVFKTKMPARPTENVPLPKPSFHL